MATKPLIQAIPGIFQEVSHSQDEFPRGCPLENAVSSPRTTLCCAVLCLVAQSYPTLWDPKDCSVPDSSIHGILQARILEWVTIPFSRGSSQSRDWTQLSLIAGRFFTVWATREAPKMVQTLTECLQHFLSSYYMNQQSHTWPFITEIWKFTLTQYMGKYQYMNVLATLFIIEKL